MTYYRDEQIELHHGDALDVLRTLDAGSVDCVVTSPPYYGLRDYGQDGQLGLEPSPAAYVARLVTIMAEVRRVLADDGTLWLNLGDSYATTPVGRFNGGGLASRLSNEAITSGRIDTARASGLPAKNLLGIPWKVAFALQDDGWILRNAVVWSKPNAMPESVTDRLSSRYEHVFLFAKRARYWFDLDPIREAHAGPLHMPGNLNGAAKAIGPQDRGGHSQWEGAAQSREWGSTAGRNPGDVWTIPTAPFPGAHFACFPPEIPRRCILAGCTPRRCGTCGHAPEKVVEKGGGLPRERTNRDEIGPASGMNNISGAAHAKWKAEHPDVVLGWTDCGHGNYHPGTVLDPFHGSGTTGMVAGRLGRRYVGIELNREYLDLSLQTRLAQGALIDDGGGAA